MTNMREEYLMQFDDGPFPGRFTAPPELDWPLPEIVQAKGHADHHCGEYKKVWQSSAAPKDEKSRRGARYEWKEPDGPPQLA